MNLMSNEWFYATLRLLEKRKEKLNGILTTKDKLIGYFSDEEINYLIRLCK